MYSVLLVSTDVSKVIAGESFLCEGIRLVCLGLGCGSVVLGNKKKQQTTRGTCMHQQQTPMLRLVTALPNVAKHCVPAWFKAIDFTVVMIRIQRHGADSASVWNLAPCSVLVPWHAPKT